MDAQEINKLSNCHSISQLNTQVTTLLAEYELDQFAFTFYADAFHTGQILEHEYVTKKLKNWHQHFHESGYEQFDTIGKRVRKSNLPVVWNLESEHAQTTGRQKAFYQDALQYGLSSGVSVPIYGPHNQFSILVVQIPEIHVKFQIYPSLLLDLQLIAIHYHARVYELLLNNIRAEKDALFSRRELQCIHLAKQGLGAKEIAKKLGIVKRTVDFHFASINKKVGAINKFHALQLIDQKKLLEPGSDSSCASSRRDQ